MPITAIFDTPGMSQKQYNTVVRDLDSKGFANPDGRLYHSASVSETGMFVVDVWESKEQLAKFAEVLVPVLIAAGVTPAEPVVYSTHNVISG